MEESPIFAKSLSLVKWLLERTAKYPKQQRFVLAKHVEDNALAFHECLLRAVKDGRVKSLAVEK